MEEIIPVVELKCSEAFNLLTDFEKNYAYYLSKASWEGSKICLFQCSNESPLLFILFQRLFNKISSESILNKYKESYQFMEFASCFYSNMGNYNSFGDDKFIPKISKENFMKIFADNFDEKNPYDNILLNHLKEHIEDIYSNPKSKLGFPPNEVTTYYSNNISEDEIKIIQEFMEIKKWSPYNTRIFKINNTFVIKVASASKINNLNNNDLVGVENLEQIIPDNYEYNGLNIKIEYGDYDLIMKNLNEYLEKAQQYSSNDNQHNMIDNYIKSFEYGSLPHHIHGSYIWTQDKNPNVESYIGFIESYRDPQGVRGEFEGFVAVVNKETSKKFNSLVENATKFIKLLPWDKKYEKEVFLKPDFTSLDVISFGSSGIPSGINIPNYDSVRQNYGFKNVALSNVISSKDCGGRISYISEEDQELFKKYSVKSFELQVGLHELLGHGTGKLLNEYYENKTYDTVFTDLASSIEECRAECVGMFLCFENEILNIFSHDNDDVSYVNWLSELRAGLMGLKYYHPETDKWGQAHMQARYVILKVCLEAGNDLIKIIYDENSEDKISIKVNRHRILDTGIPAIGKFLEKLQEYKSTANAIEGREFFKRYSEVDLNMMKYRDLIISTAKARPLMVQPNLIIDDNNIIIKSYESNHIGLINSFIDRFNEVNMDILELYEKEKYYH